MAVYVHACGQTERLLSASVHVNKCVLGDLARAISKFVVENFT
jgi:hypothetical protein